MAKKNWIAGAVGKNPGGLHKSLGVPDGERIPDAEVKAATKSKNPRVRKQAQLAVTLKGLK